MTRLIRLHRSLAPVLVIVLVAAALAVATPEAAPAQAQGPPQGEITKCYADPDEASVGQTVSFVMTAKNISGSDATLGAMFTFWGPGPDSEVKGESKSRIQTLSSGSSGTFKVTAVAGKAYLPLGLNTVVCDLLDSKGESIDWTDDPNSGRAVNAQVTVARAQQQPQPQPQPAPVLNPDHE